MLLLIEHIVTSSVALYTFENKAIFPFLFVCARLAQLIRSLTANQEVPGSIPGLVEG